MSVSVFDIYEKLCEELISFDHMIKTESYLGPSIDKVIDWALDNRSKKSSVSSASHAMISAFYQFSEGHCDKDQVATTVLSDPIVNIIEYILSAHLNEEAETSDGPSISDGCIYYALPNAMIDITIPMDQLIKNTLDGWTPQGEEGPDTQDHNTMKYLGETRNNLLEMIKMIDDATGDNLKPS